MGMIGVGSYSQTQMLNMDQVAAIGSTETREPPTALDWDARIHKVRPRLVAAGVAQPGSKQVLLAEDEPMVRNLIQRLLHSWGYRVFSARNGWEAMEIAQEHKGPIDLLVSDVTMPEMEGPELAEKLKAKRPRLEVILLSGYSHTEIVLQCGWKFIQKPFQLQELGQP
jgi:two-component system cell cycle sensor histidine kinase/response regulator CckA